MIKWSIIAFLTIAIGWGIFCARPNNGILNPSKNAVLLSGEAIVINWDATDAEADAALALWRAKR